MFKWLEKITWLRKKRPVQSVENPKPLYARAGVWMAVRKESLRYFEKSNSFNKSIVSYPDIFAKPMRDVLHANGEGDGSPCQLAGIDHNGKITVKIKELRYTNLYYFDEVKDPELVKLLDCCQTKFDEDVASEDQRRIDKAAKIYATAIAKTKCGPQETEQDISDPKMEEAQTKQDES